MMKSQYYNDEIITSRQMYLVFIRGIRSESRLQTAGIMGGSQRPVHPRQLHLLIKQALVWGYWAEFKLNYSIVYCKQFTVNGSIHNGSNDIQFQHCDKLVPRPKSETMYLLKSFRSLLTWKFNPIFDFVSLNLKNSAMLVHSHFLLWFIVYEAHSSAYVQLYI